MMHRITLEICVDSLASLEAAVAGGADRIELCAALSEGGLTPSYGFMRAAQNYDIPIHAMIRPRGGDFCYAQTEIDLMCADIATAKKLGLAGVVLGVAKADDTLDLDVLSALRSAANGMECTLHRVIDLTPDPVAALEQAINLRMDRILTSGGALTALEGTELIAQMVKVANGRIEIMPGSGISSTNLEQIWAATNVKDFHASCADWQRSSSGKVEAMAFTSELGMRQTQVEFVSDMRNVADSIQTELAYV